MRSDTALSVDSILELVAYHEVITGGLNFDKLRRGGPGVFDQYFDDLQPHLHDRAHQKWLDLSDMYEQTKTFYTLAGLRTGGVMESIQTIDGRFNTTTIADWLLLYTTDDLIRAANASITNRFAQMQYRGTIEFCKKEPVTEKSNKKVDMVVTFCYTYNSRKWGAVCYAITEDNKAVWWNNGNASAMTSGKKYKIRARQKRFVDGKTQICRVQVVNEVKVASAE